MILVIFFTALLLFTVGCTNQDTKTDMDVYSNGIIQIEHPKPWVPREEDFTNISIINFEIPDKDFKIGINLSKLRDGINAEDQLKLLEDEIKSTSQVADGINLLESGKTSIGNQDAVEIMFITPEDVRVYRIMTAFHEYLLSLEAGGPEDSFKEYEDIINHMVQSLEILPYD